MSRMPLSAVRPTRAPSHFSVGWVVAVVVTSLAIVACVIVAAAWVIGGRAAPTTSSVHELLPPEPRQSPAITSGENEATSVSALQPPVAVEEDYVIGEAAGILPGALESATVKEIPVDRLSDLKSLGWALPFLDRAGFSHDFVETSSANSERTIQARLSDGVDFINVAETRAEVAEAELHPLREKLDSLVDVTRVSAEVIALDTGHEATVFLSDDSDVWTAAIETPHVQYVVTTSLPAESAAEVASWVMVTDRSRVHLSHSAPGPADRLERGFDEMLTWFDAE